MNTAFDLEHLAANGPWSVHELRHAVHKTSKRAGYLALAGKKIPCFKQGVRWIVWSSDWERATSDETEETAKPKQPAAAGGQRRYTW
jgi:hypothetical protein